jgi:hypothetical protein
MQPNRNAAYADSGRKYIILRKMYLLTLLIRASSINGNPFVYDKFVAGPIYRPILPIK